MKRIVVVDDDRLISAAVREILQPEGYAVDCPPDPREALVRRSATFRTSSSSTSTCRA